MPFDVGIKLYVKALEKNQEQRAWDMWIVSYPHMTQETFVPFSEFYKSATVSRKPSEEILSDVARIRAQFGGELP